MFRRVNLSISVLCKCCIFVIGAVLWLRSSLVLLSSAAGVISRLWMAVLVGSLNAVFWVKRRLGHVFVVVLDTCRDRCDVLVLAKLTSCLVAVLSRLACGVFCLGASFYSEVFLR